MPWLKLLHLAAVIVWSGALLYLPAVLGAAATGRRATDGIAPDVPRRVLVMIATPAALVAIMSGSAIFLLYGPVVPWLAVKLGFVGVMVLAHGACAWLVLRAEARADGGAQAAHGAPASHEADELGESLQPRRGGSDRLARLIVGLTTVTCLIVTAAVVLSKPPIP